jgi:hypothetical protein
MVNGTEDSAGKAQSTSEGALRLLDTTAAEPRGWVALEIVWLLAIFFLFAGSPPPNVGEAHYLAKAKHYWQPDWVAGDLFLESGDAHGVFYWTFGWVTQFVSLEASAWLGRVVIWLLLAWSWRRLSWALVPVRLASLLSAGLMLFFLRNFHMAGEWIVGGVEAKGFAYVFVFLALEALVRGRWRAATLLAGAATAFHVLVGGWTLVCLAVAWLCSPNERLPLRQLWPALVGAVVVALPGLVPALLLTRGIDPAIVAQANEIYVFDRLPHHLVFHRFKHIYMVRFAALLVAWGALAWSLRGEAPLRRLNWFVLTTIGLALVGVICDQALLEQPQLAAKLLKYYWFRLGDAVVPVTVALMTTMVVVTAYQRQPKVGSWLLLVAVLVAGGNLVDVCYRRSQLRLPGSFLQPHPMDVVMAPGSRASEISASELFDHWLAATRWIEQNTPKEARFLTPRRQQTFKWYAQRPEVVNWKDVPQDAAAVVAWREAMDEVYPPATGRFDLAAHRPDELRRLAEKYNVQYVLLDRRLAGRSLPWPRVYPAFDEENPAYEVYLVPPKAAGDR